MGVGIYVKTRDRVEILDSLRSSMESEGLEWVGGGPEAPPEATRLLLLPPNGSWCPLYPEDAETAVQVAADLALQLKKPVLVVGPVEDMAFFYKAYGPKGNLVDEYHSCPDYSKEFDEPDASDEELKRTRGKPDEVAALLGLKDRAAALKTLLEKARIERLRDHDVDSGGYVGNSEPLRLLGKIFGLPDLFDEFDVLWELGPEDDDEDMRYLAYDNPNKKRTGLGGFIDRLVGSDDDDDDDDDEDLDEDEEPKAEDEELDEDADDV